MVSKVGRDLLKNTIRTIDYHNRILEEQSMWRQKSKLERLDFSESSKPHAKKRLKNHKHEKFQPKKLEDNKPERWDHNGFLELYPDAVTETNSKPEEIQLKSKKRKKKKSKEQKKCKKSKRYSESSVEEVWVEASKSSANIGR